MIRLFSVLIALASLSRFVGSMLWVIVVALALAKRFAGAVFGVIATPAAPFALRLDILVVIRSLSSVVFAPSFLRRTPRCGLSAKATSGVSRRAYFSIPFCKLMAMIAVLFKAARSPHIFGVRHGLQMVWIHAGAVAAFVIKKQAIGNRPIVGDVRQPMGQLDISRPMSPPIGNAIAESIQTANPKPATAIGLWEYVFQDNICRRFATATVWAHCSRMMVASLTVKGRRGVITYSTASGA